MGLCMYNKKTGKTFDIGYGIFFWLKYRMLEAISKNLANEWKELPLTQTISFYFVKQLKKLGLYDLIMHSDCDGKLLRRELKRINKALSKIDKIDDNYIEVFLELKGFIKETVEQGGIIIFC